VWVFEPISPVPILEASEADPELGASAALLQGAGWKLLVISAVLTVE
jgi:hypothetical protein